MRRPRGRGGFSLVGTLAGAAFVVISLLGATAAILSGSALAADVATLQAASRAATSVMEDVRAVDFADLVDEFNGKTFQLEPVGGLDSAVASVSTTLLNNGSTSQLVYEVSVTVTFEGPAGSQSFPFVTYVSDRVAGNSLSSVTETPSETTKPRGRDPARERRPSERPDSAERPDSTCGSVAARR